MPRNRRRKIVLSSLLVLYVFFFMFGGCADKLVLFPSTAPVRSTGAVQRLIPFEKGQLDIWVSRTPAARDAEPRAFVLAFVGNAARAEFSAADVDDWGNKAVEVRAMNHPGFGASTGPASLDRLGPAALAAYDDLAREAAGRPIFLSGYSLGCTLALHVASQRPAAGLLLRSPPPLQNMILRRHGWWNLWLLAGPVAYGIPAELNALRSAPKVSAPAVFLLIDADEVVPLAYQQKVASAYAGPSRQVIFSGGLHNDALGASTRAEWIAGIDWLWQSGGLGAKGDSAILPGDATSPAHDGHDPDPGRRPAGAEGPAEPL